MLESVVGNRTHDPHRQVLSKRSLSLRAAALAVGITVSGLAGAAYAAPMTYRFEVLDAQVRPSRDTTDLRVRLVRQADGQPVTGAALDDVRLGMWPIQLHKAPPAPWMPHVVGPAVAEGSGVYRLPADFPMTGSYRLTLSAHVPGEVEPVQSTVTVRAAYR
jgi:hypothetical protein